MSDCQHQHVICNDYETVIQTDSGPEYTYESHTVCADCGAELEVPEFDVFSLSEIFE